jgi:hypothetical protein
MQRRSFLATLTTLFGAARLQARSARSRWSSYSRRSSERANGHRPISRCVAAVLRLAGSSVQGWGLTARGPGAGGEARRVLMSTTRVIAMDRSD